MMRSFGITAALVVLMTGPAVAQLPRVGIIDFYGLRELERADLVSAIGVQIGDTLVMSAEDLRARLTQVPGVLDADVSLVCCEAGRSIMYVGVREASAPMLEFHPEPTGSERLPPEMLVASSRYMRALMEGIQRGESGEDDSEGHSLSAYAPARAEQISMIAFAADNVPLLRAVLRNAENAEHRALAAQMIAYTPNKKDIVSDLVYATRDPDGNVRNNALRALGVMAIYEQSHPEARINVPYAPFIDLLNSLEWTDRNKASFALVALTTTRDPELMHALRERGLTALVEMARWRSAGHAMAAVITLGRLGGIPEDELFETFQENRDALIDAALNARPHP